MNANEYQFLHPIHLLIKKILPNFTLIFKSLNSPSTIGTPLVSQITTLNSSSKIGLGVISQTGIFFSN